MISRASLVLLSLALVGAPVASGRLAAAQNSLGAPQAAPDLSSPEAAIRSFILALNAKEASGANCILEAKIDADLQGWVQEARKAREDYQVTVLSVQPQVDGDRATATVTFDVKAGARQNHLEESLPLQKVGADWKIVPATETELARFFKPQEKDPPVLALYAAAYRHPKLLLAGRDAAREADCRTNVQELAQGALTFTQDSDDKFDLRADAWKTAVEPYVKHRSAFFCLSDNTNQVAYSFNAQLQGKRVDAIRKPEQTVLIYEGKKGVLTFRHHGRAMVGLANGKVKAVTAAEAKTLRWAP